MSDGGKGSKPRPYAVAYSEFASNWDRVFNKDKPIVESPSKGDQRVNNYGELEEYSEGYWMPVENRR
jgi:hypothetical protein